MGDCSNSFKGSTAYCSDCDPTGRGVCGCNSDLNKNKSVDSSDYVSREKYSNLLAATAGLAGLVVGIAMTTIISRRCNKGSDTSSPARNDGTIDIEMSVP